jgi:hypothetical protein
MRTLPALAVAVLATALGPPGAALAHGDPASHALETQRLYVSFTAVPSAAVDSDLRGHMEAAKRLGSPMSVTLVAGEADVIEDPSMLRDPQRYAEFVDRKLAEDLERPLGEPIVVVTPYGLGVAGHALRGGRFGPVTRAAARDFGRGIRFSPDSTVSGDQLARAAVKVVRRIARAGGHPLPARVPPATAEPALAPPSAPAAAHFTWSGPRAALAVFVAVFGGAALLYEALSRLGRRKRRPAPSLHPHRTEV